MDWQIMDGVLDALTDREAESNKTTGELYEEQKQYLIEARKENAEMELSDFIHEWADSHTEVYTTEVFKWYSKEAGRYYYADEATQEFGHGDSVVKDLMMGIYKFLEEWAYMVLDKNENAEDEEGQTGSRQ